MSTDQSTSLESLGDFQDLAPDEQLVRARAFFRVHQTAPFHSGIFR